MLILNADDWGRDSETTDRTYECFKRGALSSVSAMVFMTDSERAATIARDAGIETGLHLNLTTELTGSKCARVLLEHQRRIRNFLCAHPAARAVFHPCLVSSFEYVVNSQYDEFAGLYGSLPERIDGHHHMHLCANVLVQGLLPRGKAVRRNFSFSPGEKPFWNRFYRRVIDSRLARHHPLTDYLFSLTPLEPVKRLNRIFSLAQDFVVEIETHPAAAVNEYRFLMNGKGLPQLTRTPIAHVSGGRQKHPDQ